MTMTKKRHDDRPARRRSRYKRLAVLGLLTLGSNLGCGREMLRIPAGADGSIRGPAPIPYSASTASRKSESIGPVALKAAADYGSTVAELFPTTYRDSSSYGPHLASTGPARPSHGESPLSDGLLTASQQSRIPMPTLRRAEESRALDQFTQPSAYARQNYRDPAAPPSHQARAAAPPEAPPVQGSSDLIAACGLTKIPPPQQRSLTYFPDLERASKATGIPAPVLIPVQGSMDAQPQPSNLAASPTPIEPSGPETLPGAAELAPEASAPSSAPAEITNQSPMPTERPMEPPAQPLALTEPPSQEPSAAELPAPANNASAEVTELPPAVAEAPQQAPIVAAALPQTAPPMEAPAQLPAPAEVLAQASEPLAEAPAQPPAMAELPPVSAAPPVSPNEQAVADLLPSEPTDPAQTSASPALTEAPDQTPVNPELPTGLPPLAELASELPVLTKGTKEENPGSAFEDTSIPPPTPPQPGPQPQSDELNVAFDETKIPPPSQVASQSHGQSGGAGPDQDQLPPLQVDPSVFGLPIELPPPPPLPSPDPAVASTSECPACVILRQQKESDHWATGPVQQTVYCPSCEENHARSGSALKPANDNLDLDAALKNTQIDPPIPPDALQPGPGE